MQKHAKKLVVLGLLAFTILIFSGCGKREEPIASAPSAKPQEETAPAATAMPAAPTLPDVIRFSKSALYPEGVDYDAKGNRFLVTSLREGIVGAVSGDGNYQVQFQDNHMVSAIGIRIDSARDRVLVCNSDPGVSIHTKPETQGKLAGLGVFQLSTGALIKYIDLAGLSQGGGHFCNDIALGGNGVAYITDSFSPIIYKIDADLNASIMLTNDRFSGEGFNLNGIVVKDDYLLVSKYNEGVLFKVPLNEPEKFSQVTIAETFPGADGLLWTSDGSFIVIANMQTNKVFKLTSADNWASATIASRVDTGEVFATTGVDINGAVYTLHAMLHVLFNPETKQHVEAFEIHKVQL
jgi:DNA-binding beta-propeller fold protein YncE